MNVHKIVKIQIMLALLNQHNKIHHLSLGFSVAACFLLSVLIVSPEILKFGFIVAIIVILMGVYQILLALRIGFDIDLFKRLVCPKVDINIELGLIDNALVGLKLIPQNKVGRDLDLRVQGTYMLFKKQTFVCLLQAVMIIASGIYYLFD